MRRWLLGLALAAATCASLTAQQMPWQSDGAASSQSKDEARQTVRYLFPEQVSLPARKASVVDLHFKVADGFHINSHAPREKSFIRTDIMVAEPSGINISAVDFPPGEDYAFAFNPSEKLSVYTGEFVLRAHITAAPGEHLIQAYLRYQACDAQSCYPPKKIPVAIDVIAK